MTARGEGNLLVPMKAALAAMATLGEVADVLRGRVRGLPTGRLSWLSTAVPERRRLFWPLFDLVVRTPRLEIRLPREDEFGSLMAVIAEGSTTRPPCRSPRRSPTPVARARARVAQWWWRQRAEWTPEKWNLTGAVFVDGQVVGVQDMKPAFRHFALGHTGSWLGRAHQGQGLGKEMRQAILHLAFAGLGR